MGRAMIIICAGVLVSLGIISMSTADQGKLLTQKTTTYANNTAAKNAGHTGIQIAMQKISDDTTWAATYSPGNEWEDEINGTDIFVSVEYLNDDWANNQYFESDKIRIVSKAVIGSLLNEDYEASVISVYEMAKFSDLVPDFEGALTLAADPENYSFESTGSASISGNSPNACEEEDDYNKPAVTTTPGGEANLDDLSKIDVEAEPSVYEKSDLTYQPTDELIERLSNTDGVKYLSGTTGEQLGTADEPAVVFVEDNLKLTGKQKEGFGILVIRSGGEMEYEDEDGSTLNVAGNFEWNGLVIFENAYNFKGRGTPTINGSVLVGHTEDYVGQNLAIDLAGNIHIQYDCAGETYAQMAAANLINQNKYTRVVTYE